MPRGRHERAVMLVNLPSTLNGSGRSSSTSACIAEVVKKRGSRLTSAGVSVNIFGLLDLLTGWISTSRLVFGIGDDIAQA